MQPVIEAAGATKDMRHIATGCDFIGNAVGINHPDGSDNPKDLFALATDQPDLQADDRQCIRSLHKPEWQIRKDFADHARAARCGCFCIVALNNGDAILYHGAILMEATMKNIKFDDNKDKGRPGSAWWDLIIGLTNTVSIRMVEEKFSVQSKDEQETIFDLVLRTGLASDFQAAVALLANTFPPPSTKLPFWKKILLRIPSLRERGYH